MISVCSYDPRVMETLFYASSQNIEIRIKPMLSFLCTNPTIAATIFYEMFDLLQSLQISVNVQFNMIHFEFSYYDTARLLHIFLYLHQHYQPFEENNTYENGVLYSTTSWIKIPVSIKGNEYPVSK
jgi:hypothetical protein